LSVLIINRRNDLNYRKWLREIESLVIISQVELEDLGEYTHAEVLPDFDSSYSLDLMVIELHKKYNFKAIVAISELDIVRVADLRELLNIPGQKRESAIAYRNKVVMKDLARKGNVKTAAYRELKSIRDVMEFIGLYGFPVIVKPIDLGGSMGVTKIRNTEELHSYLKKNYLKNLMIEKFVDGEMYHLDGIAVNNEIKFLSIGKYINQCMSFQMGSPLGSVLVDPNSNLFHRLKEPLLTILTSYPGAPILPFHAEFFVDARGEIFLCEIASRIGGPGINDTNRLIYGMDLMETWSRLQSGLEVSFDVNLLGKFGGWLLFPPIEGELDQIPDQTPFDWVLEYITPFKKGTKISRARHSADSVAAVFIEGSSQQECVSRIQLLDEWFREIFAVKC
jgi:hypothetical protein